MVPDLPTGDLSSLTGADVDQLTSVAYDGVPRAVDNAIVAVFGKDTFLKERA